ncbi:MAG: GNAT family N-acetyltransferase [Saprospiraceae bacterium]
MKIFFSENQPDYATYTFNYAVYCIKEAQNELPKIYEKGFLPYTGNLKITSDIFYLARSLRVNLNQFADTSENRRINRKIADLDIQITVHEKANFDIKNPEFIAFCMDYAADRFSGNAMTENRLKYVLSKETGSHILAFTANGETLGYVLAGLEGNALQYWYAFFNQAYMRSHSLGKWMMWRTIHWAKDNELAYVYLGTCYGKHSLYKVRDHKGLEFFDGSRWNSDAKLLKTLCKTDSETINKDRFKLLENPDEFIDGL